MCRFNQGLRVCLKNTDSCTLKSRNLWAPLLKERTQRKVWCNVYFQIWLKGHVLFCWEKSAAAQPTVPQELLYHPFTVNVKGEETARTINAERPTLALPSDAWSTVANGHWLRLIAAANAGQPHGEIVSVSPTLLSIVMKSNKIPKLFSLSLSSTNDKNQTWQRENVLVD